MSPVVPNILGRKYIYTFFLSSNFSKNRNVIMLLNLLRIASSTQFLRVIIAVAVCGKIIKNLTRNLLTTISRTAK